jgi:hypothetical protein
LHQAARGDRRPGRARGGRVSILLDEAGPGSTAGDGAWQWAAYAAVAHNTEFKHQQVQRLEAVLSGTTPPAFGDIAMRG